MPEGGLREAPLGETRLSSLEQVPAHHLDTPSRWAAKPSPIPLPLDDRGASGSQAKSCMLAEMNVSRAELGRLIGALRALAPGVGLSMAIALLALVLSRLLLPQPTLTATNDAVGNYLQTLGTIYAVLLAFAVYVVWTEHTDVRQNLEAEANELFGIYRMAAGLPEHVSREIRRIVCAYVENLLDVEWKAMAKGDESALSHGWHLVGDLWDALRAYEPRDERCSAVYAQLLGGINDLCTARTSRITSGRSRIPLPLRVLLYAGAVSTVGSLCLLGVKALWIHAAIVTLLSGAVAHVLVVIEDLDDPFTGYWQAPKEPFQRLLEHVRKTALQAAA